MILETKKVNMGPRILKEKAKLYEQTLLQIKNEIDNVDPDGHFDEAFYGIGEIVDSALKKGGTIT